MTRRAWLTIVGLLVAVLILLFVGVLFIVPQRAVSGAGYVLPFNEPAGAGVCLSNRPASLFEPILQAPAVQQAPTATWSGSTP